MPHFFNSPQRKIQFFLFIILFKITFQQDTLEETKQLVDQANILFNQVKEGKFNVDLATEWMQKNVIGLLCHGEFELKMGESFRKLQNEFCNSLKSGNFQNLKEILQTTKIEKKTFNKSRLDKALAKDQICNGKNKRILEQLLNNSINLLKDHETLLKDVQKTMEILTKIENKAFDKRQMDKAIEKDPILNGTKNGMIEQQLNNSSNLVEIYEILNEAEMIAACQQQKANGFMARRKKRANNSAIKGCVTAVFLTVISAPYLAYYSNKYSNEGNVMVQVTRCYKPYKSSFYRCHKVHHSVVTMIVEWTIVLAVALICALLFCSCVR